jgi:ABC-type glycerol-3-phosphate transport system permease component
MTSLAINNPQKTNINHKTLFSLAKNTLFYIAILTLICVVVGPFFWMFVSSISPQVELTATPPHWFPQNPTLFRYEALFIGAGDGSTSLPAGIEKFIRGLTNSMIVSTLTTLVCVSTGTLAA